MDAPAPADEREQKKSPCRKSVPPGFPPAPLSCFDPELLAGSWPKRLAFDPLRLALDTIEPPAPDIAAELRISS